ncbi:MAG TPA: NAD(P)-dependent oxidoreductase [Terriglobales bacterium]|jgi:3-hydroxyisobutyrate dehydrogenase-like beta-hydroxyacid dehydrogenase|nr:NAD(P)-dependent oxidoreductase [Terriglobales bacterium]
MRIAFLGLGIMGRPMASRLVAAGHEVSVWNRSARQHVEGANTAVSPADAAKEAEVVWCCVADTAAVERVIFADDGALQSLREGAIVVDSSTISPSATMRFAERVNERGVHWVDAPVTGSKIGAENGQLIFIVGGATEPVEYLDPLFKAMGKLVIHIGGTGKGQSAKLCMNLMLALIYEGFAEAYTLGQKMGVDPHKLIELVQASMVRSGAIDYKAPFVLRRDYTPNFPLRLMHKDIHLMLDLAKEHRVKLPALETVDEIYELSSEEGWDDLDYAATLGLLEKWAGVSAKGK